MPDILFEQLVSSDMLTNAWSKVKAKGSAGGIDHVDIAGFASNAAEYLHKLLQELSAGQYSPMPYQRFYIEKNETEKRKLGLLTIRDKIVQTAVTELLTPILEKGFLDVSYGYRPDKGPVKAVARVKHLLNQPKNQWLVSCDIDSFFDTIPHGLLFNRLSNKLKSPGFMRLIKLFTFMGSVNQQLKWEQQEKGVPQGGIISPLLANFYLNPLDQLMVSKKIPYVRYADDFIIVAPSEQQAKEVLLQTTAYITQKLSLELNQDVAIYPVKEGFEFLGLWFKGNQIQLTPRKTEKLKTRITNAFHHNNQFFDAALRQTLEGIGRYYGRIVPQPYLETLDRHVSSLYLDLEPKLKKQLYKQMLAMPWLSDAWRKNPKTGLSHQKPLSQANQPKPMESMTAETPISISPQSGNATDASVKKAVKSRKKEYQKLEAQAYDLLLNEPGLSIGKSGYNVSVKQKGRIIKSIKAINLKSITFIGRGTSVSTDVIWFCAQKNIPINFLQFNGQPFAKLYIPENGDADTGLAQLQAYAGNKGMVVAQGIVEGKVNNQLNLIKHLAKYYKGKDNAFTLAFDKAIKGFEANLLEVATIELTTPDEVRGKLFAAEGRSAALYWEMIRYLIEEQTGFNKREHQGATDLVNSMLNYGYALLYSRVWEAIVRAGLNPHISFLHSFEKGRPSLVFDLIEEFRQQVVDKAVVALITKGETLKMEKTCSATTPKSV